MKSAITEAPRCVIRFIVVVLGRRHIERYNVSTLGIDKSYILNDVQKYSKAPAITYIMNSTF